jgi:hypothetical protein
MSSLEQADFIDKLIDAQHHHGRLREQEDVVNLTRFYWILSSKFKQKFVLAFFAMGQFLRETPYVKTITAVLMDSKVVVKNKEQFAVIFYKVLEACRELEVRGVKRQFLPARLAIFYARPSILLLKWTPGDLLDLGSKFVPLLTVHTRSAEHGMILVALMKLHGLGGPYASQSLFRTLIIAMGLPYKSEEFVVMGSGAGKKKYEELRAMGFRNMFEINRHLAVRIDAGEFAFLLCAAKLL